MLMNPTEFLKEARQRQRAVAAFNIYNLETMQAVAQATKQVGCPLFIQASPDTVAHAGADYLVAMASVAARRGQAVALHLDHARDLSLLEECLKAGFTSVMYDGSRLPLEENIYNTRQGRELASAFGAGLEAELGHVGQAAESTDASHFTCPLTAADFVERTGVDFLAVAVGTAHGVYNGEPRLDFLRLEDIAAKVSIPLVLHGGSGVPAEAISRAIALGVAKINIATELKIPFTEALMIGLGDISRGSPGKYDPRHYMERAREAVTRTALEKATLCWLNTRSEA